MIVLGFNGSVASVNNNRFNLSFDTMHDAGAALIDEGKIICAFEEERLNRIKHTNKFPVCAINACLDRYGIDMDQVDAFAFSVEEGVYDLEIAHYRNMHPDFGYTGARDYVTGCFKKYFDCNIDPARIVFVNHHLAHAASTYYVSGFNNSLILAIDGWGDNFSGGIYEGKDNEITTINRISHNNSLGNFYLEITQLLGFDFFDEYKVMGLAPYGNKERYRHVFDELYTLKPEGGFELHRDRLRAVATRLPARRQGEPIAQEHKDIAAALQDAIERIILHVVRHYQAITGHEQLCLAGGVSLNCTMTGKLLYEQLFRDVFVQPASNDSGLPLGAALHTFYSKVQTGRRYKLEHVYLGNTAPDESDCKAVLKKWGAAIGFQRYENIAVTAARLIAEGNVIGWFQGTSEFGPRALGNRSILADPRPAGNKDLINRKIKNREGFRPFAPSVIEEQVYRFFELPDERERYGFMTFILKVKEEYHSQLAAITHVDGTARLQSVSREVNPKYYALIEEFGCLTGIPVVLNTSFNNNCEPIVDTPEHAISCFLTTNLDYLVIGDYLVEKKRELADDFLLSLYPTLPPFIQVRTYQEDGVSHFEIGNTYNSRVNVLSGSMYALLKHCDGTRNLRELMAAAGCRTAAEVALIIGEIKDLWALRCITLVPGTAANISVG